ncbi:MAG TPA: tRNA lysidine(34) synthetase TilS [Candidatus Dormibacteraeota bacterium]
MAVSGGPDSTALLLLLRDANADLVAAHYDHALRPESAADAEWVASLCRRLGVPLVSERRKAALPGGSLEAAARTLRYDFLERAAQAERCELIAVAHTADDQAETVVLNLLRGAAPTGLRGMPHRRGQVVRPLLGVTREQILEYMREQAVGFLEDASNRDRRFLRARVRHLLMPRLDRERLLRLAKAAARLSERAEAQAALDAKEPVLRGTALRRLYQAAGGPQPGLGRRHLKEMDSTLRHRRRRTTVALPGRLAFRLGEDGRAEITEAPPELVKSWRLNEGGAAGPMVRSGQPPTPQEPAS